jgi:hypothetical protein
MEAWLTSGQSPTLPSLRAATPGEMILLFQENLEFKRHYHQCSKVESVFMLKKHFGDYVLSHREEDQFNELLFKVNYNLYRLGEVALTVGLDIGLKIEL